MPDVENDAESGKQGTRKIPVGQPLTAQEKFLFDWAHESYKASIPLFNDTLGKVLTLSTAMTGGGLAMLDKGFLPGWAKVVTLLLFFASLVLCVVGLFPFGGRLILNPDMIRNQANGAITHKRRFLLLSISALAGGLLFAIIVYAVQLCG